MINYLRDWWFFRFKIEHLKEWRLRKIRLDVEGMSIEMKSVIVRCHYESPESIICDKLVEPGDRVLELGGAIGYIGLHCLINRKAASVVSVEANPVTAKRLRRNYELNGQTPRVIEAALSQREEPVEFSVGEDFWADGLHAEGSNRRKISISGKPFDALYRDAGGDANVLIVDVEGAEKFVDWSLIPSTVTKIILEIHPEILGFPDGFSPVKTLMNNGFEVQALNCSVLGFKRVNGTN